MDSTNDTSTLVKDRLAQLEKQLKVFKIKSCLLIYFYLIIYGKTNPSMIKADLQLSKATLFRNLNFLIESGFIVKTSDEKSLDKRSTSSYFAAKPFSLLCELSISEDVKKYAIKQEKHGIIDEWNEIVRESPMIYSMVLT